MELLESLQWDVNPEIAESGTWIRKEYENHRPYAELVTEFITKDSLRAGNLDPYTNLVAKL